jgi:hypothetical protein
LAVPLKHCTSGFYSIHQIVELPERNSKGKGTEAQPQHTFSNTSHSLNIHSSTELYIEEISSLSPRKKKKKKKQSKK